MDKVCSKCGGLGPFKRLSNWCKKCAAANEREWRQQHPDKTRIYRARQYQAHKETRHQLSKGYYESHKEHLNKLSTERKRKKRQDSE